MKKEEDFSEWYNEIVERANLTDKRYPIKGMNVWTPYGWKIMRLIDSFIREELDDTGHDEVCFPLLIPETEFEKEKEHIKGFDEEVYWVTHAGLNELDVRLVMRPTSETAMYPIFALWVRSHSDLPLKTYQIVNTFRYETKQTRAFIRVREIHFFESHTCHIDEEDAQRQVEEDFEILENLMKKLCLSYLLLKRTEWDKFPGAYYTVGIDTIMPGGRTLQLGSVHHYRDNFSVPFDIKYEDIDGSLKHTHQTTYGMSERLVGAIVGVHGDDQGLVLPPDVAPFQVVIVPILAKGKSEEVMKHCYALRDKLKNEGFRIHLDERDDRPGSKFYDWEIKGVPLRLELGSRDIKEAVVTFSRRDQGIRGTFKREELADKVRSLLSEISEEMRKKAKAQLEAAVVTIESLDEVPKKILRMGWCGSEECGREIEETTDLNLLGTPYAPENFKGKCIVCGKETSRLVYAARAM
ncbi:MAG: proline--tRNA ligase [Methanomassiliicoccales archaeon]|nr:proline--tRNA ligase [Methanomassiliicoccales archaeon]NYT14846.1 proline--tRNA ligase [Methanomassiliicoccales archaeon]